MRIAFTSCMNTTAFKKQPVWKTIGDLNPDQLVLLGDSVYLDVPWAADQTHPRDLSDNDFVAHGLQRYAAQLAVTEFAKLVKKVPTHPIWDDHDFLWNESYEERAITRKVYKGKIRATRSLFKNYVETLKQRLAPGSFPKEVADGRLWTDPEVPPGYRFVDLGSGVALHLTDGRSWRVRKTLLGDTQRQQIAEKMASMSADTVHLLASGSVVQQEKGDAWSKFDDFAWLGNLAQMHKILVLSGDIHDNRPSVLDLGAGKYLFDATASGAAVGTLVILGEPLQNFGVVDISDDLVEVHFIGMGAPNRAPVRIKRSTWKPQ